MPRWINEGLAEYYQNKTLPFDPTGELFYQASMAQRTAQKGQLVSLTELESSWGNGREAILVQYAQSHMAIRYVIELGGHSAVAKILESINQGSDISTALRQAVGKNYDEFDVDFASWILVWGANDQLYQEFFEGSSGELFCYNPCSTRISSIDVSLANLTAEAAFINPTRTSLFEYGFSIREFIDIMVASDGTWKATAWSPDWLTRNDVDGGRLEVPFDTGPGRSNHLRVTALGDEGCLFVNDESVSCFELPAHASEPSAVSASSLYGDVWYRGFVVEAIDE